MTYLIGCSYHGKDQGWRVRKCLATPESLVFKKIAFRDGMIWVKSDDPKVPGRYINPADLLRKN